jgi:hypothetical protein
VGGPHDGDGDEGPDQEAEEKASEGEQLDQCAEPETVDGGGDDQNDQDDVDKVQQGRG